MCRISGYFAFYRRCFALADPAIPKNDEEKMLELVRIYDGAELNDSGASRMSNGNESSKIYTLKEDILKGDGPQPAPSDGGTRKYGLWEAAPGRNTVFLTIKCKL